MSAPTHTAGPWAAFTDDSGARPHTNIVSVVPVTDCVFSLPGHHKDEANVRLIAAAPDLLEACKLLVKGLGRFDGPTLGEMAQAEAAISKATGESAQ